MITKESIRGGSPNFGYLLTQKRRNIYVALEDLNYFWNLNDIKFVIDRWNDGKSLFYISKELKRDIDEVAILIIDITARYQNIISERSRGLLNSLAIDNDHYYCIKTKRFYTRIQNGYEAFKGFDTVDFVWDESVIKYFEDLWNNGFSLEQISKKVKRNTIDCFILLLDRLRKGSIFGRKGILDGWM